jgi:tetratricopeptide (TPR) repeat protein
MNRKVAQGFRRLFLEKRTGVLICEARKVRRSLYFQSGFVVGARSTLEEDRLGEIMIWHGRITRQQLQDASHFIKSGWKLGEILAQLGVIEKEEIERFVGVQLLDIACSVFLDRPRRLAFSDLSEVESVSKTPLSVAKVLMEVARRTPRIQRHLKAFREDERPLRLSTDSPLRLQDINLTPEEAYILSRIDGYQRPRAIFSVSSLPEEQTVRTLLGLLQSTETPTQKATSFDGVRGEVEQLFERFRLQDRWEVLGLQRGAGSEDIKRAFQDKAYRFHSDRYNKITDPEFQEKLSYVFHRLSEAFATLSRHSPTAHEGKRARKEVRHEERKNTWSAPTQGEKNQPGRRKHPREPKVLFDRAKKAFHKKDFRTAARLCQQAVEIVGDRGAYYHLLGLAQAENPKWRHDAERNFKIAINLNPWKPEYFAALGELYQRTGMPRRAESMFEEAKAIDPSFPVPARGPSDMMPVGAVAVTRQNSGSPENQVDAEALSVSSASIPQRLGRYVVQETIGRGSMGVVYLAKDPAIDRIVAIKLIQAAAQLDTARLEKYGARFYREAKAAGKLSHPSIVTVFDVGHTEEETPFMVMEYVQGKMLKEVFETETLQPADTVAMASEILDALGYAHSQGVIHRDINTTNILLTHDRHVKIMDFGIAHVIGSVLTQTGEILGTPHYMAPEQILTGTVDERTDLFGFGVVLYRMLTGKLPFVGDLVATVTRAIVSEEPASPDSINPAVSPAVSQIVLRCLAKDAALRFASAEEIKRALDSLETTDGIRSWTRCRR